MKSDRYKIMIECYHDFPIVGESSAFTFHSNMTDLKDSTVGDTILIVIRIALRAMSCLAIGYCNPSNHQWELEPFE